MEVLNLLCSLLGLPTEFGGSGDWNEVQRGPWVLHMHNLKGGEARGLAWCPIESKFSMGKQLIPLLDILLHKWC